MLPSDGKVSHGRMASGSGIWLPFLLVLNTCELPKFSPLRSTCFFRVVLPPRCQPFETVVIRIREMVRGMLS